MNRIFVRVECLVLEDGSAQPKKIIWLDGREFPIRRVIHACPASNGEYEGIRYTVLIGSAEKYLYQLDARWYVDSG